MSRLSVSDTFLSGDSEMCVLIRNYDWSRTALGPRSEWSQELSAAVQICLESRHPIVLYWGEHFVLIYNDAWVPIVGGKHPYALGRSAREIWAEIWDVFGVLLEGVYQTGRATWCGDQLLLLFRYGFTEECYFSYSLSPVRSHEGRVAGVFTAVTETTQRFIGERRLRMLKELADRTGAARSASDVCKVAAEVLASNQHDIPFSCIYLIDHSSVLAKLTATSGFGDSAVVLPARLHREIALDAVSPVTQVANTAEPLLLDAVQTMYGELPGGPWPESPSKAIVLPVLDSTHGATAGVILMGISPRRPYDADYRSFLDLVAGHIATGIARARAYEEEMRRAEVLAELDRAKTAFFSNVSHEFRTPLTLMLGPVEDLLANSYTDLPPAAKGQLEVVNRNGLRLLRLVNSLLDFSRIEAGRMQASYVPTDLSAFTAELASCFRSATERAGLRLVVDCPTLSEPVYVDRDMWEKIVLNLLSNAFKFTFKGEIEVSIKESDAWSVAGGASGKNENLFLAAHHAPLAPRHVILTVRDTGVGIPEEAMPRLFERFYRVQNMRSRTHEGSGIGLALVQELVKLHGGSVRVESQIDEGSVFIVTIPFGVAHLPPEKVGAGRSLASTAIGATPFVEEVLRWLPEVSPAEGIEDMMRPEALPVPCPLLASEERADRPRILIVDDNADMRHYIARLLAERYAVDAVADGEAALGSARDRRPDLVLSDIMMPKLDGFGLLRALRADPVMKTIPIILLSARAGEEARIEGLEHGADDYLIKPFSARELLARVQAHLDLARVRRESAERTSADLRAMTRLHDVGTRCVRAGNHVRACVDDIVEAAIALTGADKGNIQVLDREKGTLAIAAHRGFDEPFLKFFAEVRRDEAAVCGAAMRSCERVIVEDVTQSQLFAGQSSLNVLLEAGVRAVQSTPLMSSAGTLLGMISTHFGTPHRPGERELRLLDLLARQAADYLERKQAEEKLRISEQRLQRVLETDAVGVLFFDHSGTVIHANDVFLRMTGYRAEQVAHRKLHWRVMTPPEYIEASEAQMERFAQTGRIGPYEKEYFCADGSRRWMLFAGRDLGDGTVAEYCVDITDRKRAEAALRESQTLLAGVLKQAPIGIGVMDSEGRWILANPVMESFVPRAIPSTLADRIERWRAWDDKDRPIPPDQWPGKRALRGELVSGLEMLFTDDTGRERWMLVSAAPLYDADRRPSGAICTVQDIDMLRRAQDALRESEARFRISIKNSGMIVYTADRDLRYTWIENADPAFEQEDIIGKRDDQLLPPDVAAPLLHAKEDVLRSGSGRRLEFEVGLRGRKQVYDVTIEPLRNADGKIIGLTAAAMDITERKETEAIVKANEDFLQRVFRAAAVGMCLADEDMRFVMVNPEFARIFGYEEQEMVGLDARTLLPSSRRHEAEEMHRRRLEGDESGQEWEVLTRHGERRVVVVSAARVLEREGKRFVLGVVQDVTQQRAAEHAQRESEARFRTMADISPVIIWVTDATGGIEFINQAYRDFCNVTEEDVREGRWQLVVHPDDREAYVGEFLRCVRTRAPFYGRCRIRRADGEWRWIASYGAARFSSDGKFLGHVGSSPDIHDLIEMQRSLQESEECLRALADNLEVRVQERTQELVQSQKRLRAMATELNLAEQRERKRLATELHDHLQQLLVLGRLKLGMHKRFTETAPAAAQVMKDTDEVLSDALAYTRTLVSDLSPSVLRDHGLAAALHWLSEYMRKHDQVVTVTVADGPELKLPEDQIILLFQSVRELLINSSKHAGTGQATVTMAQRDGALEITVRDEGSGFDLAAAAAAADTPNGGISSKFGLLSIRERMYALGGSFDIESAPEKGTTATLTLPLAQPLGVKRQVSGEGNEAKSFDRRPLKKGSVSEIDSRLTTDASQVVRVLLVDDHAMVRQGLRSVLDGYADIKLVGEAGNGEEAVALTEKLRPAVVVMDINMPKMNGVEATAQIKAQWPETLVIGISVNPGDHNADAMRRAGAARLLTKEAAVDDLYRTIQDAMSTNVKTGSEKGPVHEP